MWTLLNKLQKNLAWAIPISMVLGIAFGVLFDASSLKNFIIPVTFVMVYPMMVTLNVRSVLSGKDVRLQVFTQVVNFVAIPIAAFYIGRLFLSGDDPRYGLWAVGLFLIGVLPTSGMTISWTGFARGNKEAATKMVIFGLVIGSLAAPIYTKYFMGAVIDVNILHMFKQIALFVFVPMIAGIITQETLKRKYGMQIWNERLKPKFPPFSAVGVIMIAFVAMSLKARSIVANPFDLLQIILPLLVFYILTYLVLSIIGRLFFKREDAIAMVFGVVMRDLSIALAIAMTAFGQEGMTIALLISLAYVIQIQSAAWYVRWVDFIFGKAKGAVKSSPPLNARKEAQNQELSVSSVNVLTDQSEPLNEHLLPAFHRILYATDMSETAKHAMRHACVLGQITNGIVNVLHVIPDMLEELSLGTSTDLKDLASESARDELNQKGIITAKNAVKSRISEMHEQVEGETGNCPVNMDDVIIKVGNPVQNIISTAKEGQYDLIVMGTHGHGKIGQAIIGSVADEVIRTCEKPVLVVRLP